MWPFSRRRQYGEITLDDIKELAESSPTKKYLNLLMWQMVRQDLAELTLWQMQRLPVPEHCTPSELPPFASVVNRLKVMAGLDPVIYQQPKEGRIELRIGGRPLIFHARFVDIGSERSVHIRLERLDGPVPPSRPA
jgi:hypothetical protein